jgi:hypothetical protein
MRSLCLVLAVIWAQGALAQGQATRILSVFLGDTVQITASQLNPADVINVSLTAQPTNSPANAGANPPASAPQCSAVVPPVMIQGQSSSGFFIGIPPTICPGLYEVKATVAATDKNPQKDISISPQYLQVSEKPPLITGVSPRAVFLDEIPDQGLQLTFLGPISLKGDSQYSIRFRDRALPPCDAKGTIGDGQSCFQLKNSSDGQIKFLVKGKPPLGGFSGKQPVSLIHNGAESEPQELTIVNARRTTPRNYALAFTAALVVLIYLLLMTGIKALQTKPSTGNFLLSALFLDEETQTYSLSKCQFYAWTLAAILGYVFFAVAMSIVQGSAVFPDIPEGLPGILLFSAGTSVLATGIVSTKGCKGAGEVHPTLADFITTGGVIAPERLQFVIWTVVGIFTFLTIVFKSDPVTVSGLPRIPDGFLQLMGISSAGYLAGKLARKPGPVIRNLSVANVTPLKGTLADTFKPGTDVKQNLPILTVNLKGQNLDPKGNIKIDFQPLRGDMFWITGATPDPQSGFCSEFNVSLNDAGVYLEGTHTLTLVNSDAQAADAVFPISPMTIVSVQVPNDPRATAPNVTVTGTDFVDPTTAEWHDATGKLIRDFVPTVKVESATQLTVSRPDDATPGSKFKLTLISQIGLRASSKEI